MQHQHGLHRYQLQLHHHVFQYVELHCHHCHHGAITIFHIQLVHHVHHSALQHNHQLHTIIQYELDVAISAQRHTAHHHHHQPYHQAHQPHHTTI